MLIQPACGNTLRESSDEWVKPSMVKVAGT